MLYSGVRSGSRTEQQQLGGPLVATETWRCANFTTDSDLVPFDLSGCGNWKLRTLSISRHDFVRMRRHTYSTKGLKRRIVCSLQTKTARYRDL
jgi:hypothetical protein